MSEELKNVIEESLEEVLQSLKDDALGLVTDTLIPYLDEIIEDYEAAETAEAEASSSGWIKLRTKLINSCIDVVWSVTKKVVTKIFEKAAEDEEAIALAAQAEE